jgi:hypothetical protein
MVRARTDCPFWRDIANGPRAHNARQPGVPERRLRDALSTVSERHFGDALIAGPTLVDAAAIATSGRGLEIKRCECSGARFGGAATARTLARPGGATLA